MPKENPSTKQGTNTLDSSKTSKSEHGSKATKPMRVMLMGGTGTGKTTFINAASGGTLSVGRGLESCTRDVAETPPFCLYDGREVILIDTPGLDDTTRSDNEILTEIADYLINMYSDHTVLFGILYLHRITDVRMSGSSVKNLKIFMKLCGNKQLRNVYIVTTRWSEADPATAEKREKQLMDKFFKPVLLRGAKLVRHNNMHDQAREILRCLLDEAKKSPPLPLRIQEEMVDSGKKFIETDVGKELLGEQKDKYDRELQQLNKDIQDAVQEKDPLAVEELSKERERVKEKLEEISSDQENSSKLQKLGHKLKKNFEKFPHKLPRGDGNANASSKLSGQTPADDHDYLAIQSSSNSSLHTTEPVSTPNPIVVQPGQADPASPSHFAPNAILNTSRQKAGKTPGYPSQQSDDDIRQPHHEPARESDHGNIGKMGSQANLHLFPPKSSTTIATPTGQTSPSVEPHPTSNPTLNRVASSRRQSKGTAKLQQGTQPNSSSAHPGAHNLSSTSASSLKNSSKNAQVGSTSGLHSHARNTGPSQTLVTPPKPSIGGPSSIHASGTQANQPSKPTSTGRTLEEKQTVEGARSQRGSPTQSSAPKEPPPLTPPSGGKAAGFPAGDLRADVTRSPGPTSKGSINEEGHVKEMQSQRGPQPRPQPSPHIDGVRDPNYRPSSPAHGVKAGSQPSGKSEVSDGNRKPRPHLPPSPSVHDGRLESTSEGPDATDVSRGLSNAVQAQREMPVRVDGTDQDHTVSTSRQPVGETTDGDKHHEGKTPPQPKNLSPSAVTPPACGISCDNRQHGQTEPSLKRSDEDPVSFSPLSTTTEDGKPTHKEGKGGDSLMQSSVHLAEQDTFNINRAIHQSLVSVTDANGVNGTGSNLTSQAPDRDEYQDDANHPPTAFHTPGFHTPLNNDEATSLPPAASTSHITGPDGASEERSQGDVVKSSVDSVVTDSPPSSGAVPTKETPSGTIDSQVGTTPIRGPEGETTTLPNRTLAGSTEKNSRPLTEGGVPDSHRSFHTQAAADADVPSTNQRRNATSTDEEARFKSDPLTLVSNGEDITTKSGAQATTKSETQNLVGQSKDVTKDDSKPSTPDTSPPAFRDTKNETDSSSPKKSGSWLPWPFSGSASAQSSPESIPKGSSSGETKMDEIARDVPVSQNLPSAIDKTTGVVHNPNDSSEPVERSPSEPEISSRANRKPPSGAVLSGGLKAIHNYSTSTVAIQKQTAHSESVELANDGSDVDEKYAVSRALSILQVFLRTNFVSVSSDLQRGATPKDEDLGHAVESRDKLKSIVDALDIQISRSQEESSDRVPGSYTIEVS